MRCELASVRVVLAVAVVAVLRGPAAAQTPGALTLEQAIERALAANRTIAAARLLRPVDLAGVAVARERPNPELEVELTKDELPRKAVGGILPIELGGKRRARVGVANANVAAGDAEIAHVIAEVRNDIRRVYFDVVAADQRVALAEEIRTLTTRARDAAQARVQAGDVPQADLTQASLALANSEIELVAARGEAAAGRAELNALLAQPADAPVAPTDDLSSGVVPAFSDAVAQAAQANAALVALDRQIDVQAARVNLARSLRAPDAAAGASFTTDAEPEFRYGWRLIGSITLPVFSTHRAGVRLEEAELSRLKGAREALVAVMTGAIAASVARASAARDQLTRYQSDVLPLALEAERQAQVSYSAGQTGLVALVEALRTARETRQRGLQAGQEFQRALADLERATGVGRR